MDYYGPEEEETDDGCQCDKCGGEPEDTSDVDINDKPREGKREPWPGA